MLFQIDSRLLDINTGRLSEFRYTLVCNFKLTADMVRDDVREFVYDADGPAFLKRELMGFGVDGTGKSELMII